MSTKTKTKYDFYIVENSTKKLVSGYSTKSEAVQQRKLLIEQYPTMRFEIYPLAKLETSTELDVNSKKDYVELSTLDKIKKVSVDAYRYGKDKVNQAQYFLERNDVKGRIKRGARKVVDKTKQGADWLKRQWHEADFGDGKGKAEFFADGGKVNKFKVGDKVRIKYISDNSKHNNEVGTITFLRDYNYYPNGDDSVIEKKTQGTITYKDGSEESVVDFYRTGSGVVSPVEKVKFADGGSLNNDPRFIPYNGQEIMFVPVYGTFWVDDIEFDTEDLAKKYIDKEYGKFADGGGVGYEDWEMIVVSKELEKDGGKYHKNRFLVSARNIEEAREIATNLWNEEFKNSDLSLVKVMSESIYKLKYFDKYANGGGIDDYSDLYGQEIMVLKNAKTQAKRTGYDYLVYSDLKGEISFANKSEFERFFDKNELKVLYTIDSEGNTTKVKSKDIFANGGGVGYEPITKPVPTTKPQTPTKPDKNNPYKPKAIPRPKATKVNLGM